MTKEENKFYNFDLPATIDHQHFEDDIASLMIGKSVEIIEYTFNKPNIKPKVLKIRPAPILLVEGLFILHFKKIAQSLDLKFFIEADGDVALQRRLKRDLVERGYSHDDVMYKWVNHVVPAYNKYLLPYRDDCDQVIVNNSHLADDIISVTDEISKRLREKVLI